MVVYRPRVRGVPRGLAVAACALLLVVPCGAAVQTDGPLVGGVSDTVAKIFARTDGPASVAFRYSTDPELLTYQETTPVQTVGTSDFTTILTINGLSPETTYYYSVLVDGAPQQVFPFPSFKTFPPAGSARSFVFAVVTDLQNVRQGRPAPVYQKVMEEAPAFVLQIGDFDHRNPVDLDEMRTMHREVRGPPRDAGADFGNYVARYFPVFHVWDDHDYGPDNSDKTFPGRAQSWQAFQEYYPTPDLPNPAAGIWHKFSFCQAEFFMLDLRSQRDVNKTRDNVLKSMLDGDNIPNGQKAWLKDGLLHSTATWKFIISSVSVNNTTKVAPKDAWSGFMTERTELLDYIAQNGIGGVVFISGDLHSGGGIDDGTHSGRPEITVAHTNLPHGNSGTLGLWSEGIVTGNDGNAGYGLIRVMTDPDQVLIESKGHEGEVRLSYLVASPASP